MAERSSRWQGSGAILGVAIASASWFGWKLDSEPFFDDEACYVAYGYYARLLTQPNHENWLHFAAFDSPPVYKYAIGGTLFLFGRSPPDSIVPAERWHGGDHAAPSDPATLRAARIAMLAGAALGCIAMYLCGRALVGHKTGLMAAIALAASPLYYTHARRAMADDWTQAWVMLALWGFVRTWRATGGMATAKWSLVTGVFAGIAAASKLSGMVAALAIGVAVCMASVARLTNAAKDRTPRVAIGVLSAMAMLVIAMGVFVGVNPYFYAQPKFEMSANDGKPGDRMAAKRQQMAELAAKNVFGRLRYLFEYRAEAQTEAIKAFPDYALPSAASRLKAAFLEGIGRWSVLGRGPQLPGVGVLLDNDEPARPAAKRGDQLPVIQGQAVRACFGAFLAVLGLAYVWSEGKREWRRGRLPASWIFAAWAVTEIAALSRSLTLDWDRYYLGVVCVSSLLMAVGIGGSLTRFAERMVLAPPTEESSI